MKQKKKDDETLSVHLLVSSLLLALQLQIPGSNDCAKCLDQMGVCETPHTSYSGAVLTCFNFSGSDLNKKNLKSLVGSDEWIQ